MWLTKNKQYGPLTSYLSPRVLPIHFAGTSSLPSSLFVHKHVSDVLNRCSKMPEMINSGGGKVCAGWCFGGFRPYSVDAITMRPSVRWEHRERLQLVGIRKQRKVKKRAVVSLPLKAHPPPKKNPNFLLPLFYLLQVPLPPPSAQDGGQAFSWWL